jgi:hypothetical protein
MPMGLRRRQRAYVEGKCYADGKTELRRGASTPRAALGVYNADGKTWLRRGQLAVGVSLYSCSGVCTLAAASLSREQNRGTFR